METAGDDLDSTAPGTADEGPAGAFAPGALLASRFRVTGLLGKGGMGEVYAGDDLLLGERVAIKTIRRGAGADPAREQRFRREIQLARMVTHPNVCRLFEAGVHEGVAFVVMELLAGETLAAQLARRGKLPLDETLRLVEQIAAGLDAAHTAGVVHRDLKAQNVIVTEGRAAITDFGVARATAEKLGSAAEPLTNPAALVGTPAYMAPEQIEGGTITPAVDVYALGILIYEMTTGERPFRGDTPLATAVKRLSSPPPRPRGLPARWEATILRCLARDPAHRFARAGDIVDALRGRRRRWPWLIAAALPAVAVAALLARRPPPPAPPPTAQQLFVDGYQRYGLGDCLGARDRLERAVAIDPGHAEARAMLAVAWHCLGDEARSAGAARHLLDTAAALPEERRLFVEAWSWPLIGEGEKALVALEALHARRPGDIGLARRLDGYLIGAGRLGEAEAVVAAMRALPPPAGEDPRVLLADANLAALLGQPGRQLELAERAAAGAKERGWPMVEAEAEQNLAGAHLRLGQRAQALAELGRAREAIAAGGDRDGVAVFLGQEARLRSEGGEHAAARSLYEQGIATAREVGSTRTVLDLSEALVEELVAAGKSGDAARLVEELIALRRAADRPTESDEWLRGYLSWLRGDLEGARRQFQALVDSGSGSVQTAAHGGLARVDWHRGDVDRAIATIMAAGFEGPDADLRRVVVASMLLDAGAPEKAEGMAAHALAERRALHAPGGALASALRAHAALEQGHVAEAGAEIARAQVLAAGEGDALASTVADTVEARLRLAQGLPELAGALADRAVRRAADAELVYRELDARLVRAEIAGRRSPDEGRRALDEVERAAAARGYGIIVAKVKRARAGAGLK